MSSSVASHSPTRTLDICLGFHSPSFHLSLHSTPDAHYARTNFSAARVWESACECESE